MSTTWWRHQMETFSALLAICAGNSPGTAGNSPVPGEFPTQRPVTRSFDVFFDLRLNKRLSKQSWGWWFETLSHPLWRHCNDARVTAPIFDCIQLLLTQSNFSGKVHAPSGTRTHDPRLHAVCSTCWAMGVWHFSIHGLGDWLWWYRDFVFSRSYANLVNSYSQTNWILWSGK